MATFERLRCIGEYLKRCGEFEPRGRVYERVSKRGSYPGSQERQYLVYTPCGYSGGKPLPLLMVLHGCRQDHRDIQAISGFDRLADRYKFLVVYPFVSHYTDMRTPNCWGWWRPEHIAPGRGEVEDLWGIVEEVADEFAVDRRRVHIAGLSSGGGMAVAALTVHARRFASGAVVAGVPYGESPNAVTLPYPSIRRYSPVDKTVARMEQARQHDRSPAPLCIVHSRDDKTVHIQAGQNIRDSWLAYFGGDGKLVERVACSVTRGTPWAHSRYGPRFGRSLVETIFLEGPGHGWYGGSPGEFSFPAAPPVSELMWKFFRRHPLVLQPRRSMPVTSNILKKLWVGI